MRWDELVGLGWAGVFAPVADTIASLGDRLRAEQAAGRSFAPAGERVDAACAHLAVFGERKVVTALERLAHYALDRLG